MTDSKKRRLYICLDFVFPDENLYLSDFAAMCLERFIGVLKERKDPQFATHHFKDLGCTFKSIMTFGDEKMYDETKTQIDGVMERHYENS